MKITEKIDEITRIPPEYRRVDPPVPRSVKIELTARCDLACSFCATAMKLRTKGDIDFEFFKRILREMRELGVEQIGLFYLGESFLYKMLPEAVKFAKKACKYPYVFLTTNGRCATYKVVKKCAKNGLDSLKYSINASNREEYKEITGVDAFDTVIQNVKDARKAIDDSKMPCGLFASSILYNEQFREKMKPAIEEIGSFVDEHYWLPLYNQGGFKYDDSTYGTGQGRYVAGNVGRLDAMRESLPCWAVFTEGHITYDGFLAACCFDHDGRFQMGDLNEIGFLSAWHSEKFQQLRKRHLEKNVGGSVCENCIAYADFSV